MDKKIIEEKLNKLAEVIENLKKIRVEIIGSEELTIEKEWMVEVGSN